MRLVSITKSAVGETKYHLISKHHVSFGSCDCDQLGLMDGNEAQAAP